VARHSIRRINRAGGKQKASFEAKDTADKKHYEEEKAAYTARKRRMMPWKRKWVLGKAVLLFPYLPVLGMSENIVGE